MNKVCLAKKKTWTSLSLGKIHLTIDVLVPHLEIAGNNVPVTNMQLTCNFLSTTTSKIQEAHVLRDLVRAIHYTYGYELGMAVERSNYGLDTWVDDRAAILDRAFKRLASIRAFCSSLGWPLLAPFSESSRTWFSTGTSCSCEVDPPASFLFTSAEVASCFPN